MDTPVQPIKSTSAPKGKTNESDFACMHSMFHVHYQFVIDYESTEQTKLKAKNTTPWDPEFWELILCQLGISDHAALSRCGKFFKQVVDSSPSWRKLWTSPFRPGSLEPNHRTYKMQLKYFSDHVVKQGFVQHLQGTMFQSWTEVWLLLSGTHLYAFNLSSMTLPKIRLLQSLTKLGLSRVLSIVEPIRAISLVTNVMVHQPVDTQEGIKKFGFRANDEDIEWFSFPAKQLERSRNWLKVLYLYSKQLRIDLAIPKQHQ